jgi:hypothetical protein
MNIWLQLPGGQRHEATISMAWVALVGAMVSFAAGLSLDVFPYGSSASDNGGIVIREKLAPLCLGLEVRGHPGFFGGNYQGCDF